MPFQHNYITGVGNKPSAAAIDTNELVVNQSDYSLWTKTQDGTVTKVLGDKDSKRWIRLGGGDGSIYLNGFGNMDAGVHYRILNPTVLQIAGGFMRSGTLGTGTHTVLLLPSHIASRIPFLQFCIVDSYYSNSSEYGQITTGGELQMSFTLAHGAFNRAARFGIDAYFRINP